MVPQAEVRDLNGAGDCFAGAVNKFISMNRLCALCVEEGNLHTAGGFLAGVAMGEQLARCIAAGHYCASQVQRA